MPDTGDQPAVRVIVERGRCVGNGICEGIHPSVFEVGDDGVVVVHGENIRDQDRQVLSDAVDNCPAQALRIAGY